MTAAQLVDAEPFLDAMPPAVRQAIGLGRAGHGPLAAWCAAWTVSEQVRACNALIAARALANHASALGPVLGWIVGITMFNEARGPRRMLDDLADDVRAVLVGPMAQAFAAGTAAGLHAPPALWTTLVALVDHDEPALRALAPAVGAGFASDVFAIRGAARELASRVANVDRGAIEPMHAQVELARIGAGIGRRKWLDTVDAAIGWAPNAAERPPANDAEPALLDRLLVAWHATGDPALEPAIVAVGLRASGERGAITGGPRHSFHDAWRVVATRCDPADVARLLEDPSPPIRRLTELARFPPDPRIVARFARVARELAPGKDAHAEIAQLFARAPAYSTLAHIDAIERKWPEIAAYLAARDHIEAGIGERLVHAADPALLAEVAATAGADADLDALWAAHHANPSDLEHRAVLADALQHVHDPRGELIALQLAGRDEPVARARIESLIAAHGERWLPVRTSVFDLRFANGFVVALRVGQPSGPFVESFDRPEWVTVEDLAVDTSCELAPLVARMPLLVRIAVRDEDMLAGLAAAPALRAIACPTAWELDAIDVTRLAVIAGQWAGTTWSPTAFLGRQHAAATSGLHAIVHLQFPARMLGQAAMIAAESGPPETRFVLGRYRGWRGDGWVVRVRRGARFAELAWAGGAASAHNLVTAHVGALANAGFRRVRVGSPDRPATQLAQLGASIRARYPEIELAMDGVAIDLGAFA